jgi:hypothetical protein
MARLEPRSWAEILAADECWRLLASSPVGRIALVGTTGPEIFPVNIAVSGQSIVFRTDPGSKLSLRAADPRVAIEVDAFDVDRRDGWSVVATGRVVELGGDDLLAGQGLGLEPWTIGDKARWFRLVSERLTGRGIGLRASRGYC